MKCFCIHFPLTQRWVAVDVDVTVVDMETAVGLTAMDIMDITLVVAAALVVGAEPAVLVGAVVGVVVGVVMDVVVGVVVPAVAGVEAVVTNPVSIPNMITTTPWKTTTGKLLQKRES